MGFWAVQKAILIDSRLRQLSGHDSFYTVYRIDVTLREGRGRGTALNVNLTLGVNKSIF